MIPPSRTRSLPNLTCAVLLASAVMVTPAQAAPIVDQSFTSGSDLGASINDCWVFVAQTFTAGVTGTLAGVNIDVLGFDPALFPLDVAIRAVSGNVPFRTYVDSSRVPEPGSLVLLVAGLVRIFGLRRIRQP